MEEEEEAGEGETDYFLIKNQKNIYIFSTRKKETKSAALWLFRVVFSLIPDLFSTHYSQ